MWQSRRCSLKVNPCCKDVTTCLSSYTTVQRTCKSTTKSLTRAATYRPHPAHNNSPPAMAKHFKHEIPAVKQTVPTIQMQEIPSVTPRQQPPWHSRPRMVEGSIRPLLVLHSFRTCTAASSLSQLHGMSLITCIFVPTVTHRSQGLAVTASHAERHAVIASDTIIRAHSALMVWHTHCSHPSTAALSSPDLI